MTILDDKNFEEMHVFLKNNIEEMKIQVYPMYYEEFCEATGQSYSIIKGLFEKKKSLGLKQQEHERNGMKRIL